MNANVMMKHINLKQFGDKEQMEIIESPRPVPKENEKLLKILGFGINRADIVQRKGAYPPPPGASDILGLEAFGVLEGDQQQEQGGKYYCALLGGGGYSQYVSVHKDHLIPYPSCLNLSDGPGLAEVWLTAYLILMKIGQFSENQNLMIYAGASGVGTSAIQLARYFTKGNSKIFYTVSNEQKMQYCQNLGATKGYNYKTQSTEEIAKDIKEQTDGKGIQVVLDCVGASNYQLTDSVLGMDAKWVQYGLMGGQKIENFSLGNILRKRVSLIGSTVRSRDDQFKTELIQDFNKSVVPGFQSKELKLLTEKVFVIDWESGNADPVKQAHEFMESNQSVGKIIVKSKDLN